MTTPPRTPTWVEPDGTPSEPGEHPHYAIWDHEGRKWDTSDKLTARIAAHPAPSGQDRGVWLIDGVEYVPVLTVAGWGPAAPDPAPQDMAGCDANAAVLVAEAIAAERARIRSGLSALIVHGGWTRMDDVPHYLDRDAVLELLEPQP